MCHHSINHPLISELAVVFSVVVRSESSRLQRGCVTVCFQESHSIHVWNNMENNDL